MVLQLAAKHCGCGQGLKDIKYDLESDCQKRSIQGKTRLLYPSLINVASNRALDMYKLESWDSICSCHF